MPVKITEYAMYPKGDHTTCASVLQVLTIALSLFSDLCIFSFTYHLIPLTQSFSLSDSMLSLETFIYFFLQKHGKSTTYFAYYSGQPTSYMYIFKKNVFMFSAISMKIFCKVPAYMMNRQLCIFLYMYISSCSQTYTCTLNFDC